MKLRNRTTSLGDDASRKKKKTKVKKRKRSVQNKGVGNGKRASSSAGTRGIKRRRRRRAGEVTKGLELTTFTSSCTNTGCSSVLSEYKKYSNYDNPRCKYMAAEACKSRHGRIDYRGSYYACPREPLCDALVCSDCLSLFRELSKINVDSIQAEMGWIREHEWDVVILFRYAEALEEAMQLQKALKSAKHKTLLLDYAMCSLIDVAALGDSIKKAKLLVVLGTKNFGTDSELDLFESPEQPFVFVKMCSKFTAVDARRVFPDHYACCRWVSGSSIPSSLVKIVSSRLDPPKDGSGATLTCPNGAMYTGEISKGKPHGTGVMIYPDGSRFQGSFYFGLRHGMGTYTYGNKSLHPLDKFSGCYLENTRHGEGVYTYGQRSPYYGYKYKGAWEKGSRQLGGLILRDIPENMSCFVCGKNDRKEHIVLCTMPEVDMHGAHFDCVGQGSELLAAPWLCQTHKIDHQILLSKQEQFVKKKKLPRIKKTISSTGRKQKRAKAAALLPKGETPSSSKAVKVKRKKRGRPRKVKAKVAEMETKVEEEHGRRRQDDISLDTQPGDALEVCNFPCLGDGCMGEMKDYTEKKCEERGVICDLRESPECDERLGRIMLGMPFFSCDARSDCPIDVCKDCYPFEMVTLSADNTVLSPIITKCIGEQCSVKLDDFQEKLCDQRGVRCDFKRSKKCQKRFGKIKLSTTFFSCPSFPKCTVDFCQSCYAFARKGGEGDLREVKRLKPCFNFSEKLSEWLRRIRKERESKSAAKDWPPAEAKTVIRVKGSQPSTNVPSSSNGQISPETTKLHNVISLLKYNPSTSK